MSLLKPWRPSTLLRISCWWSPFHPIFAEESAPSSGVHVPQSLEDQALDICQVGLSSIYLCHCLPTVVLETCSSGLGSISEVPLVWAQLSQVRNWFLEVARQSNSSKHLSFEVSPCSFHQHSQFLFIHLHVLVILRSIQRVIKLKQGGQFNLADISRRTKSIHLVLLSYLCNNIILY